MNRLIDSLKRLLTAATDSAGELAKTASFTLEHVSWTGRFSKLEPTKHPVADAQLESACAHSGQPGSISHGVAQALLAVSDQLEWRASSKNPEEGPDVAVFSSRFTATTVIGAGGVLQSDKVKVGFSLQAPDAYYPPHAHHAEESYWIIGGNGDWKVGAEPWFSVAPGDSIYHGPQVRHAMQTNLQPLLTVWLWTSHLDCEVVIVRS